jgi:Fe-S cluster biosynthesis and repair protein YggX
MAHMVFCVRNKKEMEGLDEPPFDSEFGQKIYKNVSKQAWGEWVDRQKMLLNEYRLQPWTPRRRSFWWNRWSSSSSARDLPCRRSLFRPLTEAGMDSPDHVPRCELQEHCATQGFHPHAGVDLIQNPMGRLTRAGSTVSGRGSAW